MKKFGVFIGCMCFCAGVAWLGGFEFERRGWDVAYMFCVACVLSFCVAALVGEHL
jgi:Mg/Co/Ni transporter MgtE